MANTIEVYVDFIENQLPGLKSGSYSVQVEQTFGAVGVPEGAYKSSMDFAVRGERFNLKPSDIVSVFPPPASLGEYSSVLPHVVCMRNTFPWERYISAPKDESDRPKIEKMPWLALLVFNEGELFAKDPQASKAQMENGTIMTLAALKTEMGKNAPVTESGENEQEQLTVIYPKMSLLQTLLAPAPAMTYLCHARESTLRLNLDPPAKGNLYYEIRDDKQELVHAQHLNLGDNGQQQVVLNPGDLKPGSYTFKITLNDDPTPLAIEPETITVSSNDEFGHKIAIVVANRLPRPGAKSIAHLVSLENRYHWDGANYTFNFDGAGPDVLIPLVSLKSWSFNCLTEAHNLDQILKRLATSGRGDTGNTLRLPLLPNPGNDPGKATANAYLQSGYTALPHYFRRGGNSVSWYRGPLVPGIKTKVSLPADLLPAPCSDALLLYNEEYGMFDVSYAAAWELGRLMALRNKKVAVSLYNWKRLHQQQLLLAEQQELHSHLPFHHDPKLAVDLPDDVDNWFSQLSLLIGLPFNYLVPDEQMLPVESIRFFRLDQDWIASLIDGAFSIGRVTSGNTATDQTLYQKHLADSAQPIISGFLLRSYAVAGWPNLQVYGYSKMDKAEETKDIKDNKLKILRLDHLSPNVLLCMFEGDVVAVDLYEKPEMLHMGFDIPQEEKPDVYTKNLRNADGNDEKPDKSAFATVSVVDPANRVINIDQLFNNINSEENRKALQFDTFTTAQFALSMIEGVQKVRFVR